MTIKRLFENTKNYNYASKYNPDYCYEGTNVLVKKSNIKDANTLDENERKLVVYRQVEIENILLKGNLDFEHFNTIHWYLFQDVYSWARELRTVNISKTATFYLIKNMEFLAKNIFNRLRRENYYFYLNIKETILHLVALFGDLNALYPHRKDNSRTQG